MNKELEAILLSENIKKLDKVNDLLEDNYKQTVREMFIILLNAIKTKALIDIEVIMSNIETIILRQDSRNYKIINNVVRETNNKMQCLKRNANDKEFRKIKFRLIDLNRKMLEKKEQNTNNNLYNFYHYLIFEEKNLSMIELVLKNESNILGKKDDFNNNLLYNAIDHYCSLHEEDDEEEIKYFYEIIILFLKSEENRLVKNEKEIYIELLNRKFCKNKEHVKEVMERFQEFYSIDLKNLEKKYNIYSKVHDSIYEEIESFRLSKKNRKYINADFITIDAENATCLDDAISLKRKKDGSYEYYVAITDIPSFIPYGSLTFYDAMKKIETLYLCDKIIDMYPGVIANNFCSLISKQKRNAIIYKVLVDPSYNIDYESLEIIPGIIKVKDKLSYRQVNRKENIDLDTAKMIDDLALISFKLKSQNKVKEKYRKLENIINSDATYHHSMFADTSISANIIQESMLLTNYLSAKYFLKNNLVYVYRNLQMYDEKTTNSKFDKLLELSHTEISDTDQKKLLSILKEVMLTAHYSTNNKGHQGLNYECYSHSTSSARRFVDTFNQYLTHEQLFNGKVEDKKYYELEQTAKEVVDHINQKKKENSKFESEYNYLNSKKLIRKR